MAAVLVSLEGVVEVLLFLVVAKVLSAEMGRTEDYSVESNPWALEEVGGTGLAEEEKQSYSYLSS